MQCLICMICHEELKELIVPRFCCRHTDFHEECLNRWLSTARNCPYCRAYELIVDEARMRQLVREMHPFELSQLPSEVWTPQFAKVAILEGLNIAHVPRELQTRELCEIAVRQNASEIWFVPEELLTEEIAELAVRADPTLIYVIPRKFRTPKLKELVIRAAPMVYAQLPPSEQLEELHQLWVTMRNLEMTNIFWRQELYR